MARRHFPRSEPPPVASPRVPDVARDKGIKLSRVQRRASKEKQTSFLSTEALPQYSEKEGF